MPIFDKTLEENFEIKGEWWLPEEPDKKVAGTLTVNHDERFTLELIGRPTDSGLLSDRRDLNPEIILGVSREGVPCTLLQNMQVSSGLSWGGPHNPKYSPQFLFLFKHFNTTSEMVFVEASFSYTHLEEWIGELPFETEYLGEKSFEGVSVTVRTRNEFSVLVPKLNSTFSVFHSVGNESDSFRRLVLRHTAFLVITPNELQPFDWFQDVLGGCRDLLALLIGEPVYPHLVRLWFQDEKPNDGPSRKKAVTLYFSQSRKQINERVHPREIIVPLDKIRESIGKILDEFFSKRDNLRPVYELLLGTYYNPRIYAQFQFLSLMQALETFHRRTYESSGYIPKAEYKLLRNLLAPAVDGAFEDFRQNVLPTLNDISDVDSYLADLAELNAVVRGRVDQSNSVSLQTRVREIIDELPQSIRDLVTRNSDEFARRVVKTRDALTHYIPESKDALTGSDLYNAVVGLRILLTHLLLGELGIEVGVREEAITQNERFLNPWYVEVKYESK